MLLQYATLVILVLLIRRGPPSQKRRDMRVLKLRVGVTPAEAETCVVWTYMLAGDIVRIADGTSALLLPRGGEQAAEQSTFPESE